jgi:hypothetical protein
VLVTAFVTMCGTLVVLASRMLAAPVGPPQLVPVDEGGTIDLDRGLVLAGSERGARDRRGRGAAAGSGDDDEDLLVDGTTGR